MIPSARNVSYREADRADHAELRLKNLLERSLNGCGGHRLSQPAGRAADPVGVERTGRRGLRHHHQRWHRRGGRARRTVAQFRRHRQQLGAPDTLTEAGIVVGGVKETIMSRAAVASLEELRATGLFLESLIPDRAIVQEVRISGSGTANTARAPGYWMPTPRSRRR
ncbi:hypothetical protein [Kocuria flava]|uniref:hypothetical protein n=1 Tax=Kocuria flava TaxID=446860 RepID=UPI0015DD788A|nr:hypothetical protein [Kocuria flava]